MVEAAGDQPGSAAAATAQVQAQSLLPPPPLTPAVGALTQVTPANQIPPQVQPNAPAALSRAQKTDIATAHPPRSILFEHVVAPQTLQSLKTVVVVIQGVRRWWWRAVNNLTIVQGVRRWRWRAVNNLTIVQSARALPHKMTINPSANPQQRRNHY